MENANIEQSEGIEEKSLPQYLYKYYSFNKYTERIIVHNEIYFATPLEFNDPFDSKPAIDFKDFKNVDLDTYLEGFGDGVKKRGLPWNEKLARENIEYAIENNDYRWFEENWPHSHLKSMGIFCMTEEKDNMLMWSHYSDSYKGFCLEFDTTKGDFDIAKPVSYKNQRPLMNVVILPQKKQIANMLLTKVKLWEYEQEWRIIDYENGYRIETFPPHILTGVITGYRMENRDKADLIKWCLERENEPKLYEARPNNKEFKVDIVKISYPS